MKPRPKPDPVAAKIARATRTYATTLLKVAVELEALSDAVIRVEAALELYVPTLTLIEGALDEIADALKRLEARP
jgi:hypothetical protein